MKSAGLSSNFRTRLKKATKTQSYSIQQESLLASKEKLKSLRLQAQQAQIARNERERAATDGKVRQ